MRRLPSGYRSWSAAVRACRARRSQRSPQARPAHPVQRHLHGPAGTKINQNSVAQIFGDEPAEAAHSLGDAVLISRYDLAQIFRVHACGERRRTDKVGKHHGNLAALCTLFGRDARSTWRGRQVGERRVSIVAARRAAIASRSIQRWPTGPTPYSLQVLLREIWGELPSISFSRNAASYCSRPRLRSQSRRSLSMVAPLFADLAMILVSRRTIQGSAF